MKGARSILVTLTALLLSASPAMALALSIS